MDFQRAIELFEKSEHVGILLPQELDFDSLAATEVLSRALEEQGKLVGFLNPPEAHTIPSGDIFPKVGSFSPLPREFVISLDSSQSPISQLRYEKGEGKVSIILSPKTSSFHERFISFEQGKTICECAVAIGIKDIEEINGSLLLHPEFFTNTPLINIDISANNRHFGEVNLVAEKKLSVSELVYALVVAWQEKPLVPGLATLLLAGILSKTNALQNPMVTADTLLAASELMRLEGDYAEALRLTKESKPLSRMQLFGRAAVRSKMDEDTETLWSFLTPEDFEKTGRSEADAPEVLHELAGTFPPHKLGVLLTQDPAHQDVSATLLGPEDTLAQIRGLTPAQFQSPHLKLETRFTSFREAENHLRTLLKEVL